MILVTPMLEFLTVNSLLVFSEALQIKVICISDKKWNETEMLFYIRKNLGQLNFTMFESSIFLTSLTFLHSKFYHRYCVDYPSGQILLLELRKTFMTCSAASIRRPHQSFSSLTASVFLNLKRNTVSSMMCNLFAPILSFVNIVELEKKQTHILTMDNLRSPNIYINICFSDGRKICLQIHYCVWTNIQNRPVREKLKMGKTIGLW